MTPCCAGGLPIWWLVAEEVLLDSYLGLSSKLRAEGTELTTPMSWCCTKSLPCCTARRTCKRWEAFRLPTSTNIPESSSRFRSFASTWCIGLSIWISVKTWCQTWCTWVPIEVRCGMIVFCRKKSTSSCFPSPPKHRVAACNQLQKHPMHHLLLLKPNSKLSSSKWCFGRKCNFHISWVSREDCGTSSPK